MSNQKAMDTYEKLEKVGEGTYGKGLQSNRRKYWKICCSKKQKLPEDDEGVPATMPREVSILRRPSNDPHVVRLLGLKQGENNEGQSILCLVFEYMDADVKKYIRSFGAKYVSIPPRIVKTLMFELCKGMSFCHGHGILHR